jgi:hypothetical protein
MPLKLQEFEIPSYILSHHIIPYVEQCYLIAVEYHYVNLNKIVIILFKNCSTVNGSIHLKLNDIIGKLVNYGANIDWIVQRTMFLINRELQPYFYHKAEFDLAQSKP